MDKAKYLCVKAVYNEVDSLLRDHWRVVVKSYHPEMGLKYILRHDLAGVISIQTNASLSRFTIFKNGVFKKCQNFGV